MLIHLYYPLLENYILIYYISIPYLQAYIGTLMTTNILDIHNK